MTFCFKIIGEKKKQFDLLQHPGYKDLNMFVRSLNVAASAMDGEMIIPVNHEPKQQRFDLSITNSIHSQLNVTSTA